GTPNMIADFTAPHTKNCVHAEMDRNWFSSGQLGTVPGMPVGCTVGTFCDNATLTTTLATSTVQCGGTNCLNIDIQGFVYWDGVCQGINACPWHWEVHPWTAWRLH